MWYEVASGRGYLAAGSLGRALKRFLKARGACGHRFCWEPRACSSWRLASRPCPLPGWHQKLSSRPPRL